MNNLAYTSQKPENVAPKVEEILRKDLGLTEPLTYTIEIENTEKVSVGSMLVDAGTFLFGGNETPLFTVCFKLTSPRQVGIRIQVMRHGVGCHAGTISFLTVLGKPVTGEAALEEPKTFGTSKFVGSSNVIEKLNSGKDILKIADKLARVKSDVAGGMKMNRFCKIIPSENGTLFVVSTLGRSTSMGFSATTDAGDFISLADMIEKLI
jgi:hypothetical protein